jgi:F-type H+-transporting ATPase subunit b
MRQKKKTHVCSWLLIVTFSFAALLINMGSWAVAVEEEAGHGAVQVESHEVPGHGEEGHHGLTHNQVMNFIWHCLNFTILAFILVKFLRKPITGALKGRTESIRAAFEDLEAKRSEAERKYAEYESKLSSMDEQAERILKSFTEQGEAEKEKIIAQARETAERIKAQAEFYVQQELVKAKTELQTEVADMAVKMAEDLIRKNLNDEDHHRLISEYLERVVQKN